MARKKKQESAPRQEAVQEAPKKSVVPNALVVRGNTEWRDWLGRYAAHRRVTQAALIDQLLTEGAKRDGFEPPPPRY